MSHRYRSLLVVVAALHSIVAAQDVVEPFSAPDGTVVRGFAEVVGDWKIVGGMVESQALPTATQQILLRNGGADYGHAVEAMITHVDTSGPSAGGVVMRYDATRSPAAYPYVMFRDRIPPYDGFDTVEYGYCNGSSCSATALITGPNPLAKRVRLILQYDDDDHRTIAWDPDGSGVLGGSWSALPWPLPVGAGRAGLVAQGRVRFDDFGYFAATLWPTTGPVLRGATLTLKGYGVPGHRFIGAASLSLGAVALPAGKQLPVVVDGLFTLSLINPVLFQFSGTTDPQSGAFTMATSPPNHPALRGVWFHIVAATTSAGVISAISMPVRIGIGR